MEVRAIRESEYEECLDLWLKVWSQDMRDYFARYFWGDEQFRNDYTRVCVEDGRIVSAVHICRREVACGGCNFIMGGIANVGTLPEYRVNGYSSACLEQAIQVMEAEEFDFSMLFTGTPSHYAKLGWEHLPRRHGAGAIRADFTPPSTRVSVRPYEARDDETIRAIYASFNRRRPITVRRSPAYWRDWVGWEDGRAPGEARVAEQEGDVVGYCLADYGREETALKEIGGSDRAIFALVADTAAESLRRGVTKLNLRVPGTASIRAMAAEIMEEVQLRPVEGTMLRLLHRDRLLYKLQDELAIRWKRLGCPEGSLTMRSPYGSTRIRSMGPALHIEPAAEDGISQAALFALVLRCEMSAIGYEEDHRPFVEALFPSHDPWYWEVDGF